MICACPGCLHAAMLRSPHAHARIVSIDASAARRAPGVVGVFVAADLGAVGGPIPIYAPASRAARSVPYLGAGPGAGAIRGGGGGGRGGGRSVSGARCARLDSRRVRGAARGGRRRGGDRRGGDGRARRDREQCRGGVAAAGGRRGRRARRRPGGREDAGAAVAGRRASARAARPRRALGRGFADGVGRRADGASPPRGDCRPARRA